MGKIVRNNKSNIIRKIFSTIFVVFAIAIAVFAVGYSGTAIYFNNRYDTFFVDGQSMYPLLNKDAVDENGTKYGVANGNLYGEKNYHLDYGLYDPASNVINTLKRFDIIICTFNASNKEDNILIKRLIGLPGETIKFVNGGHLQVKNSSGVFENVSQPIEEQYLTGIYPTGEIVIGENQYYVCGDNRAHSSDSREQSGSQRFVEKEGILGKAKYIIGYCSVVLDESKEETSYKVHKVTYTWPRRIQ